MALVMESSPKREPLLGGVIEGSAREGAASLGLRASTEEQIGLVLSGGGMRGAYEVGVVAGILEALDSSAEKPPFQIFAGTSVGAINAAFFAANTQRADLGITELRGAWNALEIERHLKFDPLSFLSMRAGLRRAVPSADSEHLGRSLLDPRPLEQMIGGHIDWARLHENVQDGRTRALLVAALDVASGKTVIFSEVAGSTEYRASLHPRRHAEMTQIGDEHILASAAIPILFPARRIGSSYFCDGGLRFNTPISPAIRAGADKLVVITLSGTERALAKHPAELHEYPSLFFLAGKVLNALLLDPVVYDLAVLQRLNRMIEVLERSLPEKNFAEIERLLTDSRGASYRRIETLVFSPSEDLGALATEHIERHLASWKLSRIPRWLLSVAQGSKADWASYLLFDGGFAEHLMQLGRRDALARRQEIRDFFGAGAAAQGG